MWRICCWSAWKGGARNSRCVPRSARDAARIAGELLFESVVVGLLGSALGLGLAYLSLRVLVAMAPEGLPRINEIGINFPVLLFTLEFRSLPACSSDRFRFSNMPARV